MPASFFPASKGRVTKAPTSLVPKCGACGLYLHCKSPKMEPTGKGERKILIVGEAPGENEDKAGKHFVGDSGQLLRDTLRKVGIDPQSDVRYTNALICRPPKNATPDSNQIDYCRPNVAKTIDEFQPNVIVPLGGAAVSSLIPLFYKDNDVGGISRWSGWKIPSQRLNAWVCPTWHPSSILRQKYPMTAMLFEQHLATVAAIDSKPWDEVPDWKKDITIIRDPDVAAKHIRGMIKRGGLSAFDYETTSLKPEYEGAAIVCCSISWKGKHTIAYPWLGSAVAATGEYLASTMPKVASNLKFEDRWSRRAFGRPVRGWFWDTMNVAHCIDNRPNITSIKFQALIHLGVESYDDHIKPFLQAKGQKTNRVKREIDMDQLLLYCGLDALLEYKVARIQMGIIGVDP